VTLLWDLPPIYREFTAHLPCIYYAFTANFTVNFTANVPQNLPRIYRKYICRYFYAYIRRYIHKFTAFISACIYKIQLKNIYIKKSLILFFLYISFCSQFENIYISSKVFSF
jgi:hypothetical protein